MRKASKVVAPAIEGDFGAGKVVERGCGVWSPSDRTMPWPSKSRACHERRPDNPADRTCHRSAAAPLCHCRGTSHPATCLAYHRALTVGSVGSREHASRFSRLFTSASIKTWSWFLLHLDTRESTALGTMSLNLEKQLRFVRHS